MFLTPVKPLSIGKRHRREYPYDAPDLRVLVFQAVDARDTFVALDVATADHQPPIGYGPTLDPPAFGHASVASRSNRLRPIHFMGVMPIKVTRSALGVNTPHSDLFLSPGHAVYLDGLLIQVGSLVNGRTNSPGSR